MDYCEAGGTSRDDDLQSRSTRLGSWSAPSGAVPNPTVLGEWPFLVIGSP